MPQINEKSWFLIFSLFIFFYLYFMIFMFFFNKDSFFVSKINVLDIFYYKMVL